MDFIYTEHNLEYYEHKYSKYKNKYIEFKYNNSESSSVLFGNGDVNSSLEEINVYRKVIVSKLTDYNDLYDIRNLWSSFMLKQNSEDTVFEYIEKHLKDDMNDILSNYLEFYIAKVDNDIIGCAGIRKNSSGEYVITGLSIDDKYMNNGIEKVILNNLIKWFKSNISGYKLYVVYIDNPYFKKIFLELGFSECYKKSNNMVKCYIE